MLDTLNDICADYGLTPVGIRHALDQYKKVIYELTNGKFSKLTYNGDLIINEAEYCFKKDYEEDHGWISVKDRLPDLSHTIVYADDKWLESDRVIVITPDEVTIGYLEDDGEGPVWQNPDIGEIRVSYWMPLPVIPEECHDQC